MSLLINGVSQEVTAWGKRISLTHEEVTYEVLLHWDAFDGYELNFLDGRKFIPAPDWANDWDDVDFGSLESALDDLSEGLSA